MGIVSLLSGSTLKIRNLVSEDSGIYKCVGENFMGDISGDISLVVEEAKPEGDGYLLIVGQYIEQFITIIKPFLGGVLVALVLIAIFIVAGAYAKKYRREAQRRREKENAVQKTVPAEGMRI